MTGTLIVEAAPMAIITDLGRTRGPRFGLPANGALDQYSARVANILVGNAEHDPLIEVTASDARFTVTADALVSVTGADAELRIGGELKPMWEPVTVRAGQTISVSDITAGLRCYLALHGSFEVERLLDSCAPDPAMGFSSALIAGASVPLRRSAGAAANDHWGHSLFNLRVLRPHIGEVAQVDVIDGPDIAEFSGTADRLFQDTFTVTDKSNHVGLRLSGGPLPVRTSRTEKLSRAVPIGALEVPPGDELLILHRGRGVTAGYPVLGVVTSTSLDVLGQARPGQRISLRRIDAEQAISHARAWRAELSALRERVALAFSSLGLAAHLPSGSAHRATAGYGAVASRDPTSR